MVNPIVDLYINLLSILALLIIPAAGYATWFAWNRVEQYRRRDGVPGLMVVLALVSSIAFFISTYAGILVVLRASGNTAPIEITVPLTGTAFIIGELIPVIIMGYLIWRDRQVDRE